MPTWLLCDFVPIEPRFRLTAPPLGSLTEALLKSQRLGGTNVPKNHYVSRGTRDYRVHGSFDIAARPTRWRRRRDAELSRYYHVPTTLLHRTNQLSIRLHGMGVVPTERRLRFGQRVSFLRAGARRIRALQFLHRRNVRSTTDRRQPLLLEHVNRTHHFSAGRSASAAHDSHIQLAGSV